MVSKFIRNTKKMKGQAMAEFALTIPVFFLLVFGIIELSRFFLVYSSVFTAVREATRYGSSVGDEGILNYLDCSEIAETAVRTGHFGGVQKDLVQISYESVAPESDEVRVSIASCPDNNPGTVPTRTDDGNNYVPSLGDRIFIEIATDYVSLLGVVPNLTVDASNGRTIMLGVQSQVAVVTTEEPEGESTPEPTEDTTTPEPTEDTTTPEPTEVTTTPEPTEDTSTPEPTEDTSTPETPVVCIDPTITLQGVSYINNNNEVIVTIKNDSSASYKLNNFNSLKWDNGKSLNKITWGGTTFYEGSATSPAGDISLGSHDLQISSKSTQTIIFKFNGNSNKSKIEFKLIFYELDKPCPTEPITISNY